ncbi:3'-5' exonuclease family protein [Histomonas meleagridis]|uniref:3'-5' exonuclease family protein n=1 Tax=Histomonas meleagridis TaxID=135588 RepID=UPI00355A48DE|nr:3'-5' exonuclease family protein [Histomonas meleagridis]
MKQQQNQNNKSNDPFHYTPSKQETSNEETLKQQQKQQQNQNNKSNDPFHYTPSKQETSNEETLKQQQKQQQKQNNKSNDPFHYTPSKQETSNEETLKQQQKQQQKQNNKSNDPFHYTPSKQETSNEETLKQQQKQQQKQNNKSNDPFHYTPSKQETSNEETLKQQQNQNNKSNDPFHYTPSKQETSNEETLKQQQQQQQNNKSNDPIHYTPSKQENDLQSPSNSIPSPHQIIFSPKAKPRKLSSEEQIEETPQPQNQIRIIKTSEWINQNNIFQYNQIYGFEFFPNKITPILLVNTDSPKLAQILNLFIDGKPIALDLEWEADHIKDSNNPIRLFQMCTSKGALLIHVFFPFKANSKQILLNFLLSQKFVMKGASVDIKKLKSMFGENVINDKFDYEDVEKTILQSYGYSLNFYEMVCTFGRKPVVHFKFLTENGWLKWNKTKFTYGHALYAAYDAVTLYECIPYFRKRFDQKKI